MNFEVKSVNGKLTMTYEKETSVQGPLGMTLNIVKESLTNRGSWFMNPDFGLDLSNIQVVTNETVILLQQEITRSLAWLIDALKVARLVVDTEMHPTDRNTINVRIEVIQLDQIAMVFVGFVCVGGPSPGFTVT